ncbi:MAG: metallophosphoesterase [Polyangiaceae bacterium UTPRO1]|jgi:metallophosphoesterase (TIGR00282 family)|nr:TIGR00282 family metallophosphoesterase [Myxococcales bacterium]OQY66283.1 MAG: metallophosphoesterase [Polyangiaceae bacterium UTPRO1]
MKLVFFGDIVGKPGRRAVGIVLGALRAAERVDFVVANAENSAGGIGVDPGSARELFASGIDVLTSGNHVWAKRQIVEYLADSDVLLRPANFAPSVPGWGYTVKARPGGEPVAVINLIGRVFMGAHDCPFRTVDSVLDSVRGRARVILVDMHAEATSEKVAMGWYLDGRVSVVVGSHTHVQTADERILPGGTAYLTDAGMCGPTNSVIGVSREGVLRRFLTQMPTRFEVADGPVAVQGVVVEVDDTTGKAKSIRRLQEIVEE